MAQEAWLVIAVGAAFLLLGIAASPLGWAALAHRRTRADRESDRRFQELGEQLRVLQSRVERCEAANRARRDDAESDDGLVALGSRPFRPLVRIGQRVTSRAAGPTVADPVEPKLIAVPKLPAAHDRQAMQSGLSQRYAAIWDLADSGASSEVIARATGQPIGQIELILGLRRQLDGTRTNIPHASHE